MPDGCVDVSLAYDLIARLLRMEDWISETLKYTVETICLTPARDEDEYQRFLQELRRQLLPQGNDPLPDGAHASISDEILVAIDGASQPYNICAGLRYSCMVGAFYLSGVLAYNAYKAARGRRSWRRVGKNVSEEVAAVTVSGLAGLGVAILLAPLTGGVSLVCGALVGIAANLSTRALAKQYTGRLFNIPEDEMLEKAYITLGENQLAANNEISKAYRKKSLKFHPDKINSKYPDAAEKEKDEYLRQYLKIQAAFGMIVAARSDDIIEYENSRKHFEKITEDDFLRKGHLDIYLLIWAKDQARKIVSFFGKTKERTKYPAIANGIMPCEFFEEVDETIL